jgi:hypothetical protein
MPRHNLRDGILHDPSYIRMHLPAHALQYIAPATPAVTESEDYFELRAGWTVSGVGSRGGRVFHPGRYQRYRESAQSASRIRGQDTCSTGASPPSGPGHL